MEPKRNLTPEDLLEDFTRWCIALYKQRRVRTARECATAQTLALKAVVLTALLMQKAAPGLFREFCRLLRRSGMVLYIAPEATIRMHLARLNGWSNN